MESLADHWDVAGSVWFWFSLPLILTVFFRFNRIWSLRNLDLLLLTAVAIGVVLVRHDWLGETAAVAWQLTATSLLLCRLLYDGFVKRRPRIETNLSPPALVFLGAAGIALLVTSLAVTPAAAPSQRVVVLGEEVLSGHSPTPKAEDDDATAATSRLTPSLVAAPAVKITTQVAREDDEARRIATGLFAGVAHLAVLAGLMFIGARHFTDLRLGLAIGVLYLLLPSTVLDPNSVIHVLAAGLIVWALALYRVPWASGVMMGFACGSLLYPAFLLPVWFAFYWKNGGLRFGLALVSVWLLLLGGLALLSADMQDYVQNTLQLVALGARFLVNGESPMTWRITDELARIPIVVSFLLMLVALVIWPAKKRFEHLLAHSAAIIVGVQFWYPQQAGEYLSGYIPLFVLIAFRPKLSPKREAEEDLRLKRDNGRTHVIHQPEPVLSGVGGGDRIYR